MTTGTFIQRAAEAVLLSCTVMLPIDFYLTAAEASPGLHFGVGLVVGCGVTTLWMKWRGRND